MYEIKRWIVYNKHEAVGGPIRCSFCSIECFWLKTKDTQDNPCWRLHQRFGESFVPHTCWGYDSAALWDEINRYVKACGGIVCDGVANHEALVAGINHAISNIYSSVAVFKADACGLCGAQNSYQTCNNCGTNVCGACLHTWQDSKYLCEFCYLKTRK